MLQQAGLETCFSFQLDDRTSGVIALGQRLLGQPYSREDQALIETIVNNATAHLHNVVLVTALQGANEQLRRNVQALAVVNRLAIGATTHPSSRRLYRFLAQSIAQALDAAEGALLLWGEGGWTLAAPQATLDGAAGVTNAVPSLPAEIILAAVAAAEAATEPISGANGRTLLSTVRRGTQLVGALWVHRPPPAPPFDARSAELLQVMASTVAVLLENTQLFDGFLTQQQEQFRLRGLLEQYLAPSVAERLISGETVPTLQGERRALTMLMADMRASTELITHVDAETMVAMLNAYLGQMTDVLFRFEGTVDKFEGDAILGFFGAPEAHTDDPQRAVQAAVQMQVAFARLLTAWRRQRTLPAHLGIGIGVATGEVVVGNIGSAKRLEHTVIGPAVNLAARLAARAPAGAVLLDAPTWQEAATPLGLSPRLRPRRLRAKGFGELVHVYQLNEGDVGALAE